METDHRKTYRSIDIYRWQLIGIDDLSIITKMCPKKSSIDKKIPFIWRVILKYLVSSAFELSEKALYKLFIIIIIIIIVPKITDVNW